MTPEAAFIGFIACVSAGVALWLLADAQDARRKADAHHDQTPWGMVTDRQRAESSEHGAGL
jgi:hypothetical protein